jgi:hypothetical protein
MGVGLKSLTAPEEDILRMSENRVLRRVFGHYTEEITGEWGNFIICILRQCY